MYLLRNKKETMIRLTREEGYYEKRDYSIYVKSVNNNNTRFTTNDER